ncbi:acetyltransferase [Macrococcoides caseolyticum]|uniref:acetyltransferase n=1 Tax=Macrococcoides caseolyticum TaxID=69966 RepID=UPI001F26B8C2|nr:acetyltransferase [Macrococcus caseolyticus]MCE4955668.1 acetyltransferase [Macrococcus caseolyticus]
MPKKIMLLGNGGHAKVIADIVSKLNDVELVGYLDGNIESKYTQDGLIYDNMDNISNYFNFKFLIAIGNNNVRKKIIEKYKLNDSQFITVIDPTAVVASTAKVGIGSVVMPNAIINADAIIGQHVIINSGAIVEHDNVINDFVHISPGATLSGTVNVDEFTHIGSNATVIPNITIGKNDIIGAGSVVIRDLPDNIVAVGNPARIIKTID